MPGLLGLEEGLEVILQVRKWRPRERKDLSQDKGGSEFRTESTFSDLIKNVLTFLPPYVQSTEDKAGTRMGRGPAMK